MEIISLKLKIIFVSLLRYKRAICSRTIYANASVVPRAQQAHDKSCDLIRHCECGSTKIIYGACVLVLREDTRNYILAALCKYRVNTNRHKYFFGRVFGPFLVCLLLTVKTQRVLNMVRPVSGCGMAR